VGVSLDFTKPAPGKKRVKGRRRARRKGGWLVFGVLLNAYGKNRGPQKGLGVRAEVNVPSKSTETPQT